MSSTYSVKNLDHLGLVAGMCKDLQIAQVIDAAFPEQSQDKFISYGQLVVAMILNGLGFVGRTLHMYPESFADKPVERLIAQGIKAEHINDDALGRCLDALYEKGVSSLYQTLSEQVVNHLELPCEAVNLDSTSIHVDGQYSDANSDEHSIKLTRGYSRDHRPDLNQVVLNLITENQAGIPVYMQAANGNTNDSEGFKKIVKSHVSSLKAAQKSRYFIADAALYSAETISALDIQNQLFITRVPQKLKEAKAIIATINDIKFEALDNGYSGAWFESDYGDVKQRWLLVRSEQANKRERHLLNKRLFNNSMASHKSFKKLCKQRFACPIDAQTQLSAWQSSQEMVELVNEKVIKHPIYTQKGRPKKDQEPDNYEYSIQAELICSISKQEKMVSDKGLFILATNDVSGVMTMEKLLSLYKSQQSVEKGFRFLKSPDFLVSSLYLKKPERIEALLMVMTCCLMVYAALEHSIRTELKAQSRFFPDMKYKDSQNPTARWVFFCFQGIHELSVNESQVIIVNIKERNTTIIDCLGETYRQIYS